MTNILKEQQQANKELINEIETLKKQLADKEQDFKLRTYNAVKNVKKSERSEIAGILVTLERSFLPNFLKKDELTLENLIKGCTEWTKLNCNNFEYVSEENKKLEEKVSELEPKVVELEAKQKELETEVEVLEERVKTEQEQVKHVVETGEKWSKTQAEDIKVKNQKLKGASEKISYLEAQVEKLEEESSQKSKRIEKLSKQLSDSESQNESLKSLHYLNSKPLPALPIEEENKTSVKQSMFKQLKTKAKVKIQKLQKLIKREIFHNQEMIAKVEVKSK